MVVELLTFLYTVFIHTWKPALTRNIFSIFSVMFSYLTKVDVAQDRRDTSTSVPVLKS